MTELIVGGRGIGKTHKLLEQIADDAEALLLVATIESGEWAKDKLVEMLRERGISCEEAKLRAQRQVRTPLPASFLHGTRRHVYVDDFTHVFARVLGCDPGYLRMMADSVLVQTPQGKKFEAMSINPDLCG